MMHRPESAGERPRRVARPRASTNPQTLPLGSSIFDLQSSISQLPGDAVARVDDAAERAGAEVDGDHRADLGDEDRVAREARRQAVEQRLQVGVAALEHAEPLDAREILNELHQAVDRLRARAGPLVRHHYALVDA